MSEFAVNEDLFGRFAKIPTDSKGEKHIYKVVSLIESNGYCDVPIRSNSEPVCHKDIVPVLKVIHCGVDEMKVVRVALSDCELLPAADPVHAAGGCYCRECAMCTPHPTAPGYYICCPCPLNDEYAPLVKLDDFCKWGKPREVAHD